MDTLQDAANEQRKEKLNLQVTYFYHLFLRQAEHSTIYMDQSVYI